ncbi:DUF488 domain-containing protein [Proteus columbae]|uniref:DUF488 domain-containing protein n=1 Tax=Proteus columbae TaxID=1987580 RepID=UPI000C1DD1CE|nr:DUF488 family protein [Proteus columbae]
MITCKRVYNDKDGTNEGYRVLVDRLWPRGVKKTDFHYDEWNKEVAPSTELRKWFHAGGGDFAEFTQRYIGELADAPEHWQPLLVIAKEQPLVLLYSGKNEQQNNATVLKAFLEKQLTHGQ